MTTLHVSPGACSMSCHIAFEEAKLPVDVQIGQWEVIRKLNPQGAVPVLETEDGKILTQNIGILTYIAQRAPQLLPKAGSFEYAQAYQWLSWVASDLHPAYGPLFNDELPEERVKQQTERVHGLLKAANAYLAGKRFLVGDQFTAADALFFTVYSWSKVLEIETKDYENLNAYARSIAVRPAVQTVMKREGLIK
ncbi:MAG: glutathione binding-like protein [Bdellovibrionota bacterium]